MHFPATSVGLLSAVILILTCARSEGSILSPISASDSLHTGILPYSTDERVMVEEQEAHVVESGSGGGLAPAAVFENGEGPLQAQNGPMDSALYYDHSALENGDVLLASLVNSAQPAHLESEYDWVELHPRAADALSEDAVNGNESQPAVTEEGDVREENAEGGDNNANASGSTATSQADLEMQPSEELAPTTIAPTPASDIFAPRDAGDNDNDEEEQEPAFSAYERPACSRKFERTTVALGICFAILTITLGLIIYLRRRTASGARRHERNGFAREFNYGA